MESSALRIANNDEIHLPQIQYFGLNRSHKTKIRDWIRLNVFFRVPNEYLPHKFRSAQQLCERAPTHERTRCVDNGIEMAALTFAGTERNLRGPTRQAHARARGSNDAGPDHKCRCAAAHGYYKYCKLCVSL